MFLRSFVLAFVLLSMVGCASPRAVTKDFQLEPGHRLFPVNLDIDAGQYVYTHEAQVIEFIAQSFLDSGIFAGIERRRFRSPYTVYVQYDWDANAGAAEMAGMLVSSASLLVIPAPRTESHTLTIEVIEGRDVVFSQKYSQDVKTAMSLFHNAVEDRKAGIQELLEEFFEDLLDQSIVPPLTSLEIEDELL